MPVVNFHLISQQSTPSQDERLLKEAAKLYSEVLKSPMERVRAFITVHAAEQFVVAGELVSNNGLHAPYFDFIVLEGRPLEERHRLMVGFTDLLVDILGVQRDLVRGSCRRIEPEDWSIGGVAASELRANEIKARADAAALKEKI
jgi:phenylpyruvate tautomerase PptA (4-oxalocrotonate tautomerase family)